MIESSNRHRIKLTLFTLVSSLCMLIFTVNQKGMAKFCMEKKRRFQLYVRLCPVVDTLTPSLAAESSDSASGPSPRVLSARQRKVSDGCCEGNTPKTPKSAVVAGGGGKVLDDRVFFGSNFSVERLGDLATMSRPTLGQSLCSLLKFRSCVSLHDVYHNLL